MTRSEITVTWKEELSADWHLSTFCKTAKNLKLKGRLLEYLCDGNKLAWNVTDSDSQHLATSLVDLVLF